ncbi:MAG: hypothetical protein KAW17_04115 [Candidatus Eisenbacteria sp.]|nr:hypothetical protein [Candidatus Eisenbacteria bacterium]
MNHIRLTLRGTSAEPRLAAACRLVLVLLVSCLAMVSCREESSESSATSSPSDIDPQIVAQLRTLGYVSFTPVVREDAGRSGVTLHHSQLSYAGYNLYNTRTSNLAVLMDMRGRIVHEWSAPELEEAWHHVEMMTNGDLLVLVKGGYLARLAWDSHLLWKTCMNAHHDVAAAGDGSIYVLDREFIQVPAGDTRLPIVDDSIHLLSPSGEIIRKTSLYPFLGDRLSDKTFEEITQWLDVGVVDRIIEHCDVFHNNTVELVHDDLGGLPTKGGFLICARELDLVAIIDLDAQRVVWSWGPGELDRPHQPSVTQSGTILIFDNGMRRGYSRVLEVDPAGGEILWAYEGHPPESFYSRGRGGAQELPNGNILITESDRGRAFEVTRDREVVWEFHNPELAEDEDGNLERGVIYRMTRIEPCVVEALLAGPG